MNRRLGGIRSQSGRFGEEKIFYPLEIEPPFFFHSSHEI
jgi:hypothetical protein